MADGIIAISKVCTKCGEMKPLTDFQKKSSAKDGLHYHCKACENVAQRARLNPERNREACRKWRAENIEKAREADRARYGEDRKRRGSELKKAAWASLTPEQREAKRLALREWRAANPDKVRAVEIARNERIKSQRETDPEFKEKLNRKTRDWQAIKRRTDPEFRDRRIAANREWHKENRLRQNAYKRELNAKRRKSDVHFRLRGALRSRLKNALKGRPTSAAIRLLGCSVEELRAHIEGQFQAGMTWDNWGRGWGGAREWHIDHIKALVTFDLTDPAQLTQACHHTNLQPLWASDNLSKGAGEWREMPP